MLAGALGKRFLSAFKTSPAPPDVVTQCKSTSDKGRHGKKQGKRGSPQNFFVLEESTESIANSINEFYQLPDTISSGTDNRNIVDDNSSQKMKKQDIIELREQGVSSKDILDTILTNSKSFGQKTEYAQEKYLKKKEKIYGDVLIFQKPSISILSDFYFRRDPHKVLGMRPDSLSQVLSYANVHANQKYLIFENCFGLVVAAVLQRLGGSGLAMHCHIGSIPQRQALVCMNFTDHDLEPMKSLDLLHLLKERASTEKVVKEDAGGPVSTSSEDEPKTKKQKLDVVDINVEIDSDNNGKDVTAAPEQNQNVDEDSFVASRKLRHTNNKEENEKSVILFNETEFDALIICGKEHPLSLFKRLSVRLALSSPFVIFCQYPEVIIANTKYNYQTISPTTSKNCPQIHKYVH